MRQRRRSRRRARLQERVAGVGFDEAFVAGDEGEPRDPIEVQLASREAADDGELVRRARL